LPLQIFFKDMPSILLGHLAGQVRVPAISLPVSTSLPKLAESMCG
jgi:hypothetical protein